tara:strand:- start:80805 stop:82610 length:1806 start_codon:yes stop_codon:yes gene_type:complete
MNRIWSWITKAREITFNLLFLLLFLILFGVILGSQFASKVPDPEGKALVINPNGPIVEQISYQSIDPLSFVLYGPPTGEVSVHKILFALRHAKNDERIEHVILRLDNIGGTGQTILYDLGQALQELKDSGKNLIAISDYYNQSSYYLASFANKIILHPDGEIAIYGYSRIRNFYKSLIEKLGVTINLFRVGKYKSAMEPYIRQSMSEADKDASTEYLSVLWDSWKDTVSNNRNINPEDIQVYADSIDKLLKEEKGDTGKLALNNNLVDKLLNRTQQREFLIDLVGMDEDDNSFAKIHLDEYLTIAEEEEITTESDNKIAVIVASGSIVDGYQPPGIIGGDSTAELIRETYKDKSVKAIVLRVDSGGGSAFASEVIREEIIVAKSKGIKVIASMSNVAASGGYWIAASADEIWASHDTITGSIGVWGLIPTFENTLDKIGVNTDGISTTRIGTGQGLSEPLNPITAKAIQLNIDNIYQRFIKLVSDSRNLSNEEVEKIAQGRVWAGHTAQKIGLIDNLGNLEQAIERAAQVANIEDYQTFYPSIPTEWREQFLGRFFSQILVYLGLGIDKNFSKPLELIEDIRSYNDPKNIYLKCFDCPLYF